MSFEHLLNRYMVSGKPIEDYKMKKSTTRRNAKSVNVGERDPYYTKTIPLSMQTKAVYWLDKEEKVGALMQEALDIYEREK